MVQFKYLFRNNFENVLIRNKCNSIIDKIFSNCKYIHILYTIDKGMILLKFR